MKDLTGQIFNAWKVLEEVDRDKHNYQEKQVLVGLLYNKEEEMVILLKR